MAAIDYKEEQQVLQTYMDAKNNGESGLDEQIANIISKYLVPQKRFVEADTWLKPISDEKLLSEMKALIANNQVNWQAPKLERLPKNKAWIDSDIAKPSDTTDDQQYHYNRIIAYLNHEKEMLDDRDDVFECRNEWITFMSYATWGETNDSKLGSVGCTFLTLATAFNDYVENILLPNKFVETESAPEAPAAQVSSSTTVEAAYAKNPDAIKYFGDYHAGLLKEGFCLNFFGYTKILGAEEEVLVTDNYVAFLPSKKKGWSVGPGVVISRDSIAQISVGSEDHVEYQGITSSQSFYWTLNFETTNFQSFTRYLYLGKNEREMNQNRPALGAMLQKLGQHFPLVEGDSYTSSGGYTTSFGFGWWV
jgi:hypothetical protein